MSKSKTNIKSNNIKSISKTNIKSKSKKPYRRTKRTSSTLLNIIPKRNGRCVASILDENDSKDPCEIHITENECVNETKDTEFWRSYNCNWENNKI